MPKSTRATDAAIDQKDAEVRESRVAGLAGAIPRAKEPLKPALLNSTAQLLGSAVETLSQGHVPAPEFERVSGPVDQVPPDIGSQILTFGAFIDRAVEKIPALEPYKFDPVSAMETNAGLTELQGITQGITSDKKVLGALSGPAPEAPPEEQDQAQAPVEEEGADGAY